MPAVPHADLHAQHRAAFLEALDGDAALLFSPPHPLRNGDAEYRYRQDSDILYLTGWRDPDCAVLLRPGAEQPFILFVQEKDPERETWTGRRPGPEGAKQDYGADAAYAIDELDKHLPELLQGYRTLHYRFAVDPARDARVARAVAKARRAARRNGMDTPDAFIDPARVLHEQRLRKRDGELAILRRAAAITAEAFGQAMGRTAPGVYEYELESHIEHTFRREGGWGPGYTTIVGGGVNATILHYIKNDQALQDGDLVCVDAGCEVDGYTADVTRTWPVGGRFSDAQRELYQAILDVQEACIAHCRAGNRFLSVHDLAVRGLTAAMVRLGLLDGDAEDEACIDQHIEDETYKRYYMHGTSHWLGLDVHDAGVYNRDGDSRPLEPGMVLTIEPGLYIPEGDEDAPARFRGVGIRIEDDVCVTEGDPEVLTAAIPKDIDAVEAAVGRLLGRQAAR